MYSNRKSGFSILDIIVKILFAALFIFILVWLFQKKVPNMKPFYSNVFRENIKYMQEAGESYFTDDKMPKNIGDTVKITLSDMFDKKLILPFVDEEGNSCNQYESYVSITKEVDESYSLKTNLVCNNEHDYTIKVLGCHNYCKDNNCNKTCSIEKITSYQYKKQYTGSKTTYSCPSGYKLDGKYCLKTALKDSYSAKVVNVSTKTLVVDAKIKSISSEKVLLNRIVRPLYEELEPIPEDIENQVDRIENTTPSKTETIHNVSYSCEMPKTEKVCTKHWVDKGKPCNCTPRENSDGTSGTVCDICPYKVEVETCNNVTKKYQDTCYKDETITIPGETTYSCPTGTTRQEGSGSNLKCYKKVTTKYSCPAGTDRKTGRGSNLKCYKKVATTYSCPADTTIQEGSGSNLKCYKVNEPVTYECADKSYTLKENKCYKTVSEESTEYKCKSDYKLEGTTCKKYGTEKIKATAKKVSTKYYKYKWSTDTAISGWTKTGKTKTVDGKEICK